MGATLSRDFPHIGRLARHRFGIPRRLGLGASRDRGNRGVHGVLCNSGREPPDDVLRTVSIHAIRNSSKFLLSGLSAGHRFFCRL